MLLSKFSTLALASVRARESTNAGERQAGTARGNHLAMRDRVLRNALRGAQEGLPVVASPGLSNAVRWIPASDRPIHSWFRYREGFSPELFEHLPYGGVRLDPFCGCGTTLVESAVRGIPAFGIDISPLATFVTRTKTTPIKGRDAARFRQIGAEAVIASKKRQPVASPAFPLLKKIFLPESLEVLLRLRRFIDEIEIEALRNLLFLAWLSILEDCSSTFKEGNGLKYRNKRRRPGRYETVPDDIWIPKYFGPDVRAFVERKWIEQIDRIANDLKNHPIPKGARTHVITGSCLVAENMRFDSDIGFAVFSPPYANRFDYFEAFKTELWMGGFVSSPDDLANLRRASMRSHLAANRTKLTTSWEKLDPFLDVMDPSASSVRMGIKKALLGYFDDTRALLRSLRSSLAKQATVAVVVGNSAYARSIIPTDSLLARIGIEEGYAVRKILVARHLHVSSQQRAYLGPLEEYMRESVVILNWRA